MEQRIIAILQIRSRRFSDFYLWLKWYIDYIKCDKIYIVDDNSAYDLLKIINLFKGDKIVYKKRENITPSNVYPNFNMQQKIINGLLEKISINKNDILIIPDDDEFWWYDYSKFKSFKECVNSYRKTLGNVDAIYVPWTLMRSKEILKSRPLKLNYFDCFKYRCNISNCEHKPVLFYNGIINSSFHCGYKNGKTITNKTNLYFNSMCCYDLPLRCYHFRFTTVEEYNIKRQSTASTHKERRYMKEPFTPQIFNGEDQNGEYNIEDLTLFNTFKNVCK